MAGQPRQNREDRTEHDSKDRKLKIGKLGQDSRTVQYKGQNNLNTTVETGQRKQDNWDGIVRT